MDGLVMPPPAGLPLLPRQRAYTHTHARLQSGFSSQRAAFGPVAMRASCSERLHPRHRSRAAPSSAAPLAADGRVGALYRSNSSLELEPVAGSGGLRREFGSHGSIDAIGGDSAFAVLTEFRSLDPELAAAREAAHDGDEGDGADASPRLRSRLQRLWDRDRRGSRKAGSAEQSLFRKLRGGTKETARLPEPETTRSSDSLDGEARQEERRRRRALVHYDCQSLHVSLSAAVRRRSQLEERHNRATGASAASKSTCRTTDEPAAATDELSEDEDRGDDRSNDLVQSCPFFRNEVGGERDRALHLTPGSCRRRRAGTEAAAASASASARSEHSFHRPPSTCGLSVLEQPAGLTHWPVHVCPFSRPGTAIEHSNVGSYYYKDFFHGREHETWVGTDESLGPVAVSVRRDRLQEPSRDGDRAERPAASHTCYRVIVRSSELPTLRGLVLEESLWPLLKTGDRLKRLPVRELLDYVAPELQPSCLRLATAEPRTEDYLMKLDEQYIFNRYKVGIMYCRAGQSTEEEMYNNEESGPALDEFLEMLGQRVRLKGFDKYKAGLDNKTDSTGQYSVYVKHQGNEIMFHVSTLLQYSPNNRQQLLRKRYIGNDIVTIVFQEPGALPFTPKHIRSQFQHVFIVVRAVNPCSENTQYSVAVNRFRDVPPFGPPIPEAAIFNKSQTFAEFLYAKVINAENAAYHSEKFMTMAKRTRHEYLKDLATNYLTEMTLDAPQKFSIMSFGSRKKDRPRPRFNPDAVQRGAICWPVMADQQSPTNQVECVLGVSADSVVLMEVASGRPVFAAPSACVLGWTLQGTSLRLYYHLGECVVLHPQTPQDTEELAEIAARLATVTTGCDSQEMVLRRNQLGQLGFHVQSDGLVTEVESGGPAWQGGLRQGARIVEICKVPVCSMNYDQMVDLLKTSVAVSLVVLPASVDGRPRRGCLLVTCGAMPLPATDYENLSSRGGPTTTGRRPAGCQQQQQQQQGGRPAAASPPPPSVVSSGYGTGGSGRSTLAGCSLEAGGTLSSSSSGSAERWADESEPPPPPLRHRQRPPTSRGPDGPPPGEQTGSGPTPAGHQARPLGTLQEQGPRTEAFAYIELASMNCGILMEAKNDNSRSTYLTDPDVEVYIPGPARRLAGVPPPSVQGTWPPHSPPAARSSPVADTGGRSGAVRAAVVPGRRASHGTVPRLQGGAASPAGPAEGPAAAAGGRRNSSVTFSGGTPARQGGSVRAGGGGGGGGGRAPAIGQRSSGSYDSLDQRTVSVRRETAKTGRQPTTGSQQPLGRGQTAGAAAYSTGSVRAKRGGGSGGPGTRRIANSRSSTDLSGGRGLSSTHLSHAESDQCLSSTGGCSPLGRSRSNQALGRRLGHSSSSSQLGGRPPTTTPLGDPLTAPLGRTRPQTGSQQSLESSEPLGRPVLASRSEDELSAHSLSPTLRRRLRADASTPSSSSGRSQAGSPRVVDVRMRPPAERRASSGSYLQTELQRILSDADAEPPPPPPPAAAASVADGGSSRRQSPLEPPAETDVLLTTARPAQVVEPAVPLPVGHVDWRALVDTATRAVLTRLPVSRTPPLDASTPTPAAAAESSPSEELRTRLTTLENELVNEQSKRELLQSQVQKLSSDNQRLQEESRQAAQQLRKFTQWLLSNVEKP